jgi:AraC family transcriptional regulator
VNHYYRLPNGRSAALFTFAMPGFQASIVKTRRMGETLFEHCEPNHRILITLEGGSVQTIAQVEGAPPVERPDCPGSITVVPAGTHRRVLLTDSRMSLLTLSIAPDFAADDDASAIPLIQNGRDDWLWRAGTAFRSAAATGGAKLQCEGLALAIGRHLRRLPGKSRRVPTGLDPAALKRVLALMHDRIAENLSLADLAMESGLSISAFGRAFRHATGMTPHRYFTAMRMEWAKTLLRGKAVPLAFVAGAVGYSDQAHFTTAFARHAGLPPARWRELYCV